MGPKHPATIRATVEMAKTLDKLGRDTEAGYTLVEVLKLREEVQGQNHPETIVAENELKAWKKRRWQKWGFSSRFAVAYIVSLSLIAVLLVFARMRYAQFELEMLIKTVNARRGR